MGFPMYIGELYNAEITFAEFRHERMPLDETERSKVEEIINSSEYFDLTTSDKIDFVVTGFHSATTSKRLDNLRGEIKCECKIPAGSYIYVGIDDTLIVSDSLIVVKEI